VSYEFDAPWDVFLQASPSLAPLGLIKILSTL